jgi:hypothetical protein
VQEPGEPNIEAIRPLLEPDEEVHVGARAAEALVVVTSRRLVVAAGQRVSLDLPYPSLRRIQFDIERRRPATLVIVPEGPQQAPQVLEVQAAEIPMISQALGIVGDRLARLG